MISGKIAATALMFTLIFILITKVSFEADQNVLGFAFFILSVIASAIALTSTLYYIWM